MIVYFCQSLSSSKDALSQKEERYLRVQTVCVNLAINRAHWTSNPKCIVYKLYRLRFTDCYVNFLESKKLVKKLIIHHKETYLKESA